MGGAFDPVHLGHLHSAWEIMQIVKLSQIQFIPCKQSVHKSPAAATPEQRYAMLQLATEPIPTFIVNDCEIIRDTQSYMIDTLIHLRRQYAEQSLSLLMGTDTFMSLPTWHRWQELLDYAHLIIMQRPGYPLTPSNQLKHLLIKHLANDVHQLHSLRHGKIYIQSITELNISSTQIRIQLGIHSPPHFLIPENVLAYIQQHQLYQSRLDTLSN